MNLRQLEEMVNVLKSKGYSPETKIMIDVDELIELKNIKHVVGYRDEGQDSPAFVVLNTTPSMYPNCQAFNTNFENPEISFPLDFPEP